MKSFCHDFCRRQSFKVDFEAQKIVHPVSPEAALCLFRVLQEALHNAAKHSQRHSFKVAVGEVGGALHLSISDNGIGFDVQAAQKSGLGLISMRERTRLVNGTIDIESRPRSGTTVHVQIPIS
jgi:signal transduction histidine kinase